MSESPVKDETIMDVLEDIRKELAGQRELLELLQSALPLNDSDVRL